MARISAIVDAGFVVGALDAADQWHLWAAQLFPTIQSPALTCEAVISEACFQLHTAPVARLGQMRRLASPAAAPR